MSEPLQAYLHDHLAGAVVAVEILEVLRDQHAGEELGRFAGDLLTEVEADRNVLRDLAERAGAESNPLKEATAWVGEKVARLKLGREAAGELGTFEALEALALGILGKRALWRALKVVAGRFEPLRNLDLDELAARAEAQHARVEERRLEIARAALRNP